MIYWASIIAILGVMYALVGALWEKIFGPKLQEHRIREGAGYIIELQLAAGYQLPTRIAIFVILLSAIPILGVLFLEGWLRTIIWAKIEAVCEKGDEPHNGNIPKTNPKEIHHREQ